MINDPRHREFRFVTILSAPDRFFLTIGLLVGVTFAVLFPPFTIADEPAHFFRAYAVSASELGVSRRPGAAGQIVPESLPILVQKLGQGPASKGSRNAWAIASALWWRLPHAPLKFVDCRTSCTTEAYTFVVYLPQASGIALGRIMNASPVMLFYLARLGNLTVSIALVSWAIRLLPTYRWLMAMVALTPMAMCQSASVSADALTIAAAFLFVAAWARLAFGPIDTLQRRDFARCGLSSVLLCLTKPAYFPLTLAVFLVPAKRFPRKARVAALTIYFVTSASAVAFAIWTATRMNLPLRPGAGLDHVRQIHAVFVNPSRFVMVMFGDYSRYCLRYLAQVIGIQLGWLDTQLPVGLIGAYLLVLAILLVIDTGRAVAIEPRYRIGLAVLALASMAAVSMSLFAYWTPYGADFIEGIQGRYFIPILPAVFLLFHSKRFAGAVDSRRLAVALAMFITIIYTVASAAIVSHYYS